MDGDSEPRLSRLDVSLTTPPHPIRALPVAHTTSAKALPGIVSTGKLEPRYCKVFTDALLYLFYGGAFYRPPGTSTRDDSFAPVAFVFGPKVLRQVRRYFPFDTGAMFTKRLGVWDHIFGDFRETCAVTGGSEHGAVRLVYSLYGGNEEYLKAIPRKRSEVSDFLASVVDLLEADLSPTDVDQRQCAIECQTSDPILLDDSLLWIGFPANRRPLINRLLNTSPFAMYIPRTFEYETASILSPKELAGILAHAAAAVIKPYVNTAVAS